MDPSSDRRQFLRITVGSLLVLPVGRFLVACGGAGEDPLTGSDAPAAAPRADGASVVFSSSMAVGHFHTFAVDTASMAAPPAGGVSGATAASAGHVHAVSISMAELASVADGQSVKVTTGDEGGHTHVLTLVKVAPGGGGGGGSPDAGPDPDPDPNPDPYPY